MADARFEGAVPWPAHLSVRVIPERRIGQSIAVPFEAVWWDEENHSHVWALNKDRTISARAVATGRTYGDAVEIISGLALGDTYVTQPTDHLKEGMRLEIAVDPDATTSKKESGDGHAHGE